jgi:type IV pilus assembly protein PilY1
MNTRVRRSAFLLSAALSVAPAQPGHADEVNLSDLPLNLVEGVDPNLILTLDTSSSMWDEVSPRLLQSNWINGGVAYSNAEAFREQAALDALVDWLDFSQGLSDGSIGRGVQAAYSSVDGNGVYFDPGVTYHPPVDANGNSLGDADFTAAWDDGFDRASGIPVDLSTSFYTCGHQYLTSTGFCTTGAAYYHTFDPDNEGCDGDPVTYACYTKHVVADSDRQNFANWYSYYRSRIIAAKSAVSRAFAGLNGDIRVGYQTLDTSISLNPVRPFSQDPVVGGNRSEFYAWLLGLGDTDQTSGTPLPYMTVRAGEYFATQEPYLDDPSTGFDASTNPERSCRRNTHILFTDGDWGNPAPSAIGNYDDTGGLSLGESNFAIDEYQPRPPYRDDNSNYLADYTFYYWVNDLRIDLPDDVPDRVDQQVDLDGNGTVSEAEIFWDPKNDPARWQHMVTYTIGLGVIGELDFPDDYAALLDGSTAWSANKADDLWHAAINSRGAFYRASDTGALISSLSTAVVSASLSSVTATSLSANSGSLLQGTVLYQASFSSDGWHGDLIAYPLSVGDDSDSCNGQEAGSVCPPSWRAAALLDAVDPDNRVILTFSPENGASRFLWSDSYLTAEQQDWLTDGGSDAEGEARLEFLRGDTTGVATYGFRERVHVLGDIVDSGPLYVGPPRRFINAVEGESDYFSSFKEVALYSTRTGMVYAGVNDGMLHAFDADDGEELFSYVPFSVFHRLPDLTSPAYQDNHHFYVNGPLVEGDAFVGDAWRSVLLGALGRGGQGLFALDITSPASVTEATAGQWVLWEFTDRVDRDLGFTYGAPAIARIPTASGTKWAAIFGNGYNNTSVDGEDPTPCQAEPIEEGCTISQSGEAALYIVDLVNTTAISNSDFSAGGWTKVAIPAGRWHDPADADCDGIVGSFSCNGRANGLATVTVVDLDGDQIADTVYSGDLFGNVWKIQLDQATGAASLAFPGNTPLFSARDSNGNPQPITTRIRVTRHPRGDGLLILFGTGAYLGQDDVTDSSVQTLYAVWDNGANYGFPDGGNAITRDVLLEQTILAEGIHAAGTSQFRLVSNNRIDWTNQEGWYIDLLVQGGTAEGERVIADPEIRNDRVTFVSFIPNNDLCQASSGDSWINVLDVTDGSRLTVTPFDADLDGSFGTSDLITHTQNGVEEQMPISSFKLGIGDAVYSSPVSLVSGSDIYDYFSEAGGGPPVQVLESSGLLGRTWMDLR